MRFWANRCPTGRGVKATKAETWPVQEPMRSVFYIRFFKPFDCDPVDLSTARSPQNHLILGRLGSSEEASGINAKRRKVGKGFWAAGCSGARISCRTNISRESGTGETPPFQLGELENNPPDRMTLSGKRHGDQPWLSLRPTHDLRRRAVGIFSQGGYGWTGA
jgi:hypothetical protein